MTLPRLLDEGLSTRWSFTLLLAVASSFGLSARCLPSSMLGAGCLQSLLPPSSVLNRVKALVEENKRLASESMFVKWKAGELAKCVEKMREDHRVFLLHRKIEDLQAQINRSEKRNKEYYEQLLVRDNKGQDDDDNDDKSGCLEKKGENSDGIALEIQLHMQRLSRRFKWK